MSTKGSEQGVAATFAIYYLAAELRVVDQQVVTRQNLIEKANLAFKVRRLDQANSGLIIAMSGVLAFEGRHATSLHGVYDAVEEAIKSLSDSDLAKLNSMPR